MTTERASDSVVRRINAVMRVLLRHWLLIINVDNFDFQNDVEASGRVLEMVQAELHGLF